MAALEVVLEAALVAGMEAVSVVALLAVQVVMMEGLMMAEGALCQIGLSLEDLGAAAYLFPFPSSLMQLCHQTNFLLSCGFGELAAVQV